MEFTNSKEYCMELIETMANDGFFADQSNITKSHMYRSMKPVADANLNSTGYCNLDKIQFMQVMADAYALMIDEQIQSMVDDGTIEVLGTDDEGNLLYGISFEDDSKDNPTDFFSLN